MSTPKNNEPAIKSKQILLTSRPIPQLIQEQLDKFTKESVRARAVDRFDPASAIYILKSGAGKEVIAIDIGGNKIQFATFEVKNGVLEENKAKTNSFHSSQGKGYMEFMEKIASETNIPLGISYPGTTKDTKALGGANVPILLKELASKYNGDFMELFPTLKALINDAVAGIISGSIEAKKRFPISRNFVYIIIGSGLGGAVLKDEQIFACEPGHVEVIEGLNPYNQNKPCGVNGAKYVCIENVAAGRAGIEDLWEKQTGKKLEGPEISSRMKEGNELAISLYDNSALLSAHAAIGLGKAMDLLKTKEDTTVVFHGGVLQVPGYAARVKQIMEKYLGFEPQLLITSDFSQNACLDGAAIAALAKTST